MTTLNLEKIDKNSGHGSVAPMGLSLCPPTSSALSSPCESWHLHLSFAIFLPSMPKIHMSWYPKSNGSQFWSSLSCGPKSGNG
jgi:hypothetical protein